MNGIKEKRPKFGLGRKIKHSCWGDFLLVARCSRFFQLPPFKRNMRLTIKSCYKLLHTCVYEGDEAKIKWMPFKINTIEYKPRFSYIK